MTTLGFVVLARRPNPYKEDPWDYTPVSAQAFDTPEDAANDPVLDQLKVNEALQWLLDHDAERHRHHSECIHNLPPEEQIEMRGRTLEWWTRYVGKLPEQITPDDWQRERPPVDPVEYVIGEIVPVQGRTG